MGAFCGMCTRIYHRTLQPQWPQAQEPDTSLLWKFPCAKCPLKGTRAGDQTSSRMKLVISSSHREVKGLRGSPLTLGSKLLNGGEQERVKCLFCFWLLEKSPRPEDRSCSPLRGHNDGQTHLSCGFAGSIDTFGLIKVFVFALQYYKRDLAEMLLLKHVKF